MKKPLLLLILDGFGIGPENDGNAIYRADSPAMGSLFMQCPNSALSASGLDVGLPEGQIGNSEVGHTNIGAGRVVYQDLPKISRAIEDKSFFENEAIKASMLNAREKGKALHLGGLLSDGGVHSHIEHVFALVEMAKALGLEKVYIHAFLDGRDVPPKSGKGYVEALKNKCEELSCGKIATVMGRFYAMDRDKRFDRIQEAYNAMVLGEGKREEDPVKAVSDSYDEGITDEFVKPVVCCPEGLVSEGDSFIFFNFRPDRAREITRALCSLLPEDWELNIKPLSLDYVCMTQYDKTLPLPVAFPPHRLRNTLGEYLSEKGLTQLRIAETEKYAHVTFFFNGGVEETFPGEDRILVPSPREYPTYDLIPEMSAIEVTEKCCEAIKSGKYDVIICNLANCDMVGHTGVMDAAVKAVQTVDHCVEALVMAVEDMGGISLITADHGNADSMLLPDGSPHTAHTTNPVPLILVGRYVNRLRFGRLCDIAPTVLDLLGLPRPPEMTGKSLLLK